MSSLPVELFLALRYLRPKRTFVSVITLISVIGVTVGVAVLIVVIAVMSGFDRELREKILGFSAHLKITEAGGAMTNYNAVMRVVASNQNVKGVAPYILGQVMIKTQPEFGNPLASAPWVRGIDSRYETNVSVLSTSVAIGSFDLEGRGVLIGSELAHNLRLSVGDRIAVYSPRNLEKIEKRRSKKNEEVIPPDDYTVRKIFNVGYYEYDATVIVTSLENAQDLYRLDAAVHALLVMLDDPFKADAVRRQLARALGGGYDITLWTEENSKILDALLVEKNVMFVIMFCIMIVAAFGIMGTLIAFVVHKTR